MPYTIVAEEDWIVTAPNNKPVDGLRVTVRDEETGTTFNVEVPGKADYLVAQYVEERIGQRKNVLGRQFE